MNYKKFYNLEEYLFGEVNGNFHKNGHLTVEEFFCIVIWKANRSKGKIKARLLKGAEKNLTKVIRKITGELFLKPDPKDKLVYLMGQCGFRLPMASAILTVLYPDEFTVYDVRVCSMLGCFQDLQNKVNLDNVWAGYMQFRNAVVESIPGEDSLRNKDRWLWGKSFAEDLGRFINDKRIISKP